MVKKKIHLSEDQLNQVVWALKSSVGEPDWEEEQSRPTWNKHWQEPRLAREIVNKCEKKRDEIKREKKLNEIASQE